MMGNVNTTIKTNVAPGGRDVHVGAEHSAIDGAAEPDVHGPGVFGE